MASRVSSVRPTVSASPHSLPHEAQRNAAGSVSSVYTAFLEGPLLEDGREGELEYPAIDRLQLADEDGHGAKAGGVLAGKDRGGALDDGIGKGPFVHGKRIAVPSGRGKGARGTWPTAEGLRSRFRPSLGSRDLAIHGYGIFLMSSFTHASVTE